MLIQRLLRYVQVDSGGGYQVFKLLLLRRLDSLAGVEGSDNWLAVAGLKLTICAVTSHHCHSQPLPPISYHFTEYGICTQWYLTYGHLGAYKMAFNSDIIPSIGDAICSMQFK